MKNTISPKKSKYHLKPANVTQYDHLDDDGFRYELIEGVLTMAASPRPLHQDIIFQIAKIIANYLDKKLLGKIYLSPLDVQFNDKNIYQPDLLFVSNERLHIISEKRIIGAPDLIIEILSESSYELDTKIKYRVYEESGVQEYWIIDPNKKSMTFYHRIDKSFKKIPYDKEYSSSVLKDFSIHPQNFFQMI